MKKLLGRITTIVGVAALTFTGGAAYAADEEINDEAPVEIVVAEPTSVEEDGTIFYETGDISEDAVVVIPEDNGRIPNGLTIDELETIAASGGRAGLTTALSQQLDVVQPLAIAQTFVTSVCCTWHTFTHPTAHWGYNSSATTVYWFAPQVGTEQRACAQGYGYYRATKNGVTGYYGKWYSIGCMTSGIGSTSAKIPWGSVIARPKARFQSQHYTFISTGRWGY